MKNRLTQFEEQAAHPMNGKLYAKLSAADRETCRDFIRANDHLGKADFELAANRWGLDKDRSKNHSTMWALISQSNGPVISRRRV